MKLNMLEFQLNEEQVNNPKKDLSTRVKELRSLNNSADEICKKIATEFRKDYDDIKRLLLPADLKQFVGKTTDELEKVGEARIKEFRRKYSKYAPKSTSKSAFLKQLMNSYIEAK